MEPSEVVEILLTITRPNHVHIKQTIPMRSFASPIWRVGRRYNTFARTVFGTAALCVLPQMALAQSKSYPCFEPFNDTTWFPQHDVGDYQPMGCQATAAFPSLTGRRIWVKGSASLTQCVVDDHGTSQTVHLLPPNYSAIVPVEGDSVRVQFHDVVDDRRETIYVYPPSESSITSRAKSFSLMAYGCFEPFEVEGKELQPVVLKGEDNGNLIMRHAFERISLGRSLERTVFRSKRSKWITERHDSSAVQIAPALAMIATGDQAYVDAGYKLKEAKGHPMAVWTYEHEPKPALDSAHFIRHLDRLYRSVGSFNTLQRVKARLPTMAVWDDHEIRDGWGSQGDEYMPETHTLSACLAPYYRAAQKAFIDHQLLPGPSPLTAERQSGFHQETVIGGRPCFAFDLRSERDILRKQVISEQQLDAFRSWAAHCRTGEEVVIVSSIPLFLGYKGIVNAKSEGAEAKDDINDGWDAEHNRAQRNKVIAVLVQLRERGIKPYVISGDIHLGGLIQVWYRPTGVEGDDERSRRVLAYELIASGLSHESIAPGIVRSLQLQGKNEDLVADLELPDGRTVIVTNVVRHALTQLNFGAIEFGTDTTVIHSFMKEPNNICTGDGQNCVADYAMHADWDIPWQYHVDRSYRRVKNWLNQLFHPCNRIYTPPMAEHRNIISIPIEP